MMDGGGLGGMEMMWIFGLLLLVAVIVLVVVLVKAFTGGSSITGGRPGASRGVGAGAARGREILEERYARGELSTEEYRERLRTLEEDGR